MMKRYLVYFNHAESNLPVGSVLEEVSQSFRDLEFTHLGERKDWLHSCDVGIFHGNPEVQRSGKLTEAKYFEELLDEQTSSSDGLVVVFISRDVIPDSAVRVPFIHRDGSRGVRYLLPIKRTIQSGLVIDPRPAVASSARSNERVGVVEQWRRLLGAVLDRDALEHWFNSQNSSARDSILNEMLLEPTAPESLIALLVLCQGYLAVHAFHHRGEHQSEKVEDALRDSGVENAISDTALVVPQPSTVCNPVWWQEVFGLTEPDLRLLVAREWGTNGIEQCPKAVKDLIDAIFGGPVGPQVVAEGYLAIATRLRTA
jgi:hypothetical protein